MKLKILVALTLAAFGWQADAQTNIAQAAAAPRVWTFQTGKTISGDYYSSGTTMVVIKHEGTNCFLRISDLSSNDQAYVSQIQFGQRQARLDAETNEFLQKGVIEVNAQFIESFPEQTEEKLGWMDVEFESLDPIYTDDPELELGFDVDDKNGDSFDKCFMEKEMDGSPNPLVAVVASLKRGDKVRLLGGVIYDYQHECERFAVLKIEMIESKAEQDAREASESAAGN